MRTPYAVMTMEQFLALPLEVIERMCLWSFAPPPKIVFTGKTVDWVRCDCDVIPCCHDPNSLEMVNTKKVGRS
jgi:hypothetical protein